MSGLVRASSEIYLSNSSPKSVLLRLTPSGSSNPFARSFSSTTSGLTGGDAVSDLRLSSSSDLRLSSFKIALVAWSIGPNRGDLGENVGGRVLFGGMRCISCAKPSSFEPSDSHSGLLNGLRIRRGDAGTIGIASDAANRPLNRRPWRTLWSLKDESQSSGSELHRRIAGLTPLDLRRRTWWPSMSVALARPFQVLLRRN